MAFGRKRRKPKKKVGGWLAARKRREKRAQIIEVQRKKFEKFRIKHPEFAERIEEIRTRAAEGYQIPRSDYDVAEHSEDMYALALQMTKHILIDLDEVFSEKSNSNPYLALAKAASVAGYSNKVLSKIARTIKSARKNKVDPDAFLDYRKTLGKEVDKIEE